MWLDHPAELDNLADFIPRTTGFWISILTQSVRVVRDGKVTEVEISTRK